MTEIMEKQNWFQRFWDRHFPVYSYSCGHRLIRVSTCYSGYYCPTCELIVPEVNVEKIKKDGK